MPDSRAACALFLFLVACDAKCWAQGTRPRSGEATGERSVVAGTAISNTLTGIACVDDAIGGTAYRSARALRDEERRGRVRKAGAELIKRFEEAGHFDKTRRSDIRYESLKELEDEVVRNDFEWMEAGKHRRWVREAVGDGHSAVSHEAIRMLGLIGEPEDITVLAKVPKSDGFGLWHADVAGKSIQSRQRWSQELKGKSADERTAILVERFRKNDCEKEFLKRELIRIGPPAVPALVELLEEALEKGRFGPDRKISSAPAKYWVPLILTELCDARAVPVLQKLVEYHRKHGGHPESLEVTIRNIERGCP